MSDPLVQELREAATHEKYTWIDEVWPSQLLERAADALDAAHQREEALQEALEKLVAKIDVMTVHPSFRSVWTLAYVHGHRYDGPTIDQEMNAAKALIGQADRDSAVPGLST